VSQTRKCSLVAAFGAALVSLLPFAANVKAGLPGATGEAPPPAVSAAVAMLASPRSGPAGTMFRLDGSGFEPGETITVTIAGPADFSAAFRRRPLAGQCVLRRGLP